MFLMFFHLVVIKHWIYVMICLDNLCYTCFQSCLLQAMWLTIDTDAVSFEPLNVMTLNVCQDSVGAQVVWIRIRVGRVKTTELVWLFKLSRAGTCLCTFIVWFIVCRPFIPKLQREGIPFYFLIFKLSLSATVCFLYFVLLVLLLFISYAL